jgi:hypothetical protein
MSDTQSTVTLQGINRFAGESSAPVKPPSNHIEQYRASEQGDLRAVAAIAAETPLVAIEPNGAPLPAHVLPPPQIVTATDDGAWPDYAPVQSAPLFEHAVRASRIGKAMIRSQRKVARAGGISKKLDPAPLKRRSVVAKPRPRAVHSHSAHGTTRRKTGDSGDTDHASKSRPRNRREPPFMIGWHKNYNFPSAMGKLINPGSKAFSSHAGLSVVITGPNHAGREGQKHVVKTVAGKPTAVILGKLRETHPLYPISFYRWHFDREARA